VNPIALRTWTTALFLLAVPCPALPQEDDPGLRIENALLEYLEAPEAGAKDFLSGWIAEATRAELDPGSAVQSLEAIHRELHGGEPMDITIDAQGELVIEFGTPAGKPRWLHCALQPEPPHKILNLWIESGPALLDTEAARQLPVVSIPVNWDSLDERLEQGRKDGFEGTVLIVRDGETAFHGAYGMANRERDIANRPDTIFATGSAPIDFTFVAILLLQQAGKLDLADPITKFFPEVPTDKQAITISHLMTGASGLQNFHDVPTDRDPDHAWIDRDEAMRRIFAGELLFAPGHGSEHSHSAWGVLAAIVEIVSEQTYQEFTREHLFVPLGMTSTGFNGDPLPEERTAIGYGDLRDGSTNAPPFWGPTSWLVLGSGGQVSTTGDMARFMEAIHGGDLLDAANTKRFLRGGIGLLNGGDSYGYEIYYTYTEGTYMILMANSVVLSTRRLVAQLARDLGTLVLADAAGREGGR
jgi:CubicO group peptidase (beta-lactamase class C family)